MVIFFFLVSLLMVVLQANIFVNVIVNSCQLLCMVHGVLMVFNSFDLTDNHNHVILDLQIYTDQ
jgi:hypothetical protein